MISESITPLQSFGAAYSFCYLKDIKHHQNTAKSRPERSGSVSVLKSDLFTDSLKTSGQISLGSGYQQGDMRLTLLGERVELSDEFLDTLNALGSDLEGRIDKDIGNVIVTRANTADKTEKGDFLRKVVNNTMAKKIYREGDMLYVYIPFEETVYGVNVYDISYSGKDADNFCEMIYGGTNCESVNVKVGENVSYGIKSDFKKCKYLIPCIVTDNT